VKPAELLKLHLLLLLLLQWVGAAGRSGEGDCGGAVATKRPSGSSAESQHSSEGG
jgi:hypothetical protein